MPTLKMCVLITVIALSVACSSEKEQEPKAPVDKPTIINDSTAAA